MERSKDLKKTALTFSIKNQEKNTDRAPGSIPINRSLLVANRTAGFGYKHKPLTPIEFKVLTYFLKFNL